MGLRLLRCCSLGRALEKTAGDKSCEHGRAQAGSRLPAREVLHLTGQPRDTASNVGMRTMDERQIPPPPLRIVAHSRDERPLRNLRASTGLDNA